MRGISFVIGGQAGDGVMRTAEILGRILNRLGIYAFVINDYQSLIRGGHNFCKVRASDRQVWSHLEEVELIAALNQDTIDRHENELTEGGGVLFDSGSANYEGPNKPFPIPLSSMVKQMGGIPIMRNSTTEQVLYIGKMEKKKKPKAFPFVSAEADYAGGCITRVCPFPS